ncbi:hypothetical protein, partial [Leptospira interrogans]
IFVKLNASLLWAVETQRLASIGARQVACGDLRIFGHVLISFNFCNSSHILENQNVLFIK